MALVLSSENDQQAAELEAARVAIGRLVDQGLLDANAATRQLLALDLEIRQRRAALAPRTPSPTDS